MVFKTIMYGGRVYYHYDAYDTWREARTIALSHKRRNPRLHWYILKTETNPLFPHTSYHLYMDRVRRVFY